MERSIRNLICYRMDQGRRLVTYNLRGPSARFTLRKDIGSVLPRTQVYNNTEGSTELLRSSFPELCGGHGSQEDPDGSEEGFVFT